jgi:tetratricopeptide (TPR) repeat protein
MRPLPRSRLGTVSALIAALLLGTPFISFDSSGFTSQARGVKASGKPFAIVIGIEKYSGASIEAVPGARKDAVDFSKYLTEQHEVHIDPPNITTIDGPRATLALVKNGVERTLEKAGPDDTVYVFISARGITEQFTHRGFVLVLETNAGNWASTAIPVEWLSATFSRCRARSIYLFADLCREPAGGNEIHTRLAELVDTSPVKGILASHPNRPSLIINAADPDKRAGLFSSVLIEVLRSHKGDLRGEYRKIYDSVRGEVTKRSIGKQVPMQVAGGEIAQRRPFARLEELAMLGRPDLGFLFFPQSSNVPQIAELRRRFLEAIAEGHLVEPGGAYDILQQYRPLLRVEALQDDIRRLAIALEEGGQRAVAAYGSGEEFPNDPMRLNEHEFRKAGELFNRLAALEPSRGDAEERAWFCRGRASLLGGNWAQAEQEFGEALRISDAYPEPFNGLGVAYLEESANAGTQSATIAQLRAKAIPQFREAIRRAPEWAYPRHNLALALFESGDYRSAEREYEEAFRLAPYHPYLSYNLGLFQQRQNRLKQAEKSYEAARAEFRRKIARVTDTAATYARLLAPGGVVDPDQRRQYQQELDLANKLIHALTQNEAEVHNALGTVWEARGDAGGAAREYRAAFGLNADLLEARHNLAMMDMALYRKDREEGKLAEALQLWQSNLGRSVAHRPSLMGIAEVYRIRNRLPDAIEAYRQVLAAEPGHLPAKTQLALALAAAGDAGAEPELRAAIQLQTSAQKTQYAAAELHQELGRIYARSRRAEACEQFKLAREAVASQRGAKAPPWLKQELRACGSARARSKRESK